MSERPVVDAPAADASAIEATLDRFGSHALHLTAAAGTRITLLLPRETFRERSAVLRRLCAGVDDWPCPPAGLFVVEERTVYLRSTSPMTVAHEFAHALDCALGGGVYLSSVDPRIRRAFRNARGFITPYAASGLDEYFAECWRAWVGANDPRSPWPKATRARLQELDPLIADVILSLSKDDTVVEPSSPAPAAASRSAPAPAADSPD